jgi:peptide-methionine (R)-S-oxide reductase
MKYMLVTASFLLATVSLHAQQDCGTELMVPKNEAKSTRKSTTAKAPAMTKNDKTDTDWKKILSPDQFRVLREKGTEPAFTGKYYKHDKDGNYLCAGCGSLLFTSEEKYHSGSGWPSFYAPAENKNIVVRRDESHGMVRDEVLCAKCGGHLGHVFDDGPRPTGLRYCINSVSLDFESKESK